MLTPEYIKFAEAQLLEPFPRLFDPNIGWADASHGTMAHYIWKFGYPDVIRLLSRSQLAAQRVTFLLFVLESEGICI